MRKNSLYLLLFALLYTGAAHTQTAWLSVLVTENSGEPLAGATVEVKGIGGGFTDPDGYLLMAIKPGTYDIGVRYIGLETRNISALTVTRNAIRQLDIELSQAPVQLEEVCVRAFKVPLIESDFIICGSRIETTCTLLSYTMMEQTEKDSTLRQDAITAIALFPNPADTHTQIALNEPAKQIEIYDAKGALAHRMYNIPAGIHDISVQDLPGGLYTVKVDNSTMKVIVAH